MMLNSGVLPKVKKAIIASAQSRVLAVEFRQPTAVRVPKVTQERDALPYPMGAKSKYKIPPLFYRLSGAFREANLSLDDYAIRIGPDRNEEETVLRILCGSVGAITCE